MSVLHTEETNVPFSCRKKKIEEAMEQGYVSNSHVFIILPSTNVGDNIFVVIFC